MSTPGSMKKIQQAPDKSLKMREWGPHVQAALNAVLRTVPPPEVMSGEGWFQNFWSTTLGPACNKMPEGAIVKKYQNQTLIPHVKEFFSGKENTGASASGKTGGVKRSFDFSSSINSAMNSTPTRGKSTNPVTGGGGSVLSSLIAPNSNSTFPSFGSSIGGGFGHDDVATNGDGDADDESIGDDLPEITAEAAVPFRATYCEIEGRRYAVIILKNTPPVAKEEITFSVDHATVSVIFPEPKVGEDEMDRFLTGAQRKLGDTGTKAALTRAIATIADADNVGRNYTCTFNVGFDIDGSRTYLATTDLQAGSNPQNRCKAVMLIAPEMQKSIVSATAVDEI